MIYNITFGLFFLGCAVWVTVRGITLGWTSGDVPILILMVACLFEKVMRVIEIRRDRLHPPGQRRSEDDVTPFAKGQCKPRLLNPAGGDAVVAPCLDLARFWTGAPHPVVRK